MPTDEALIKRVLPHSIEAEQSVIGSMLMDREAIITAMELVSAEDFYQHQYGVTFESMVELFNEGKPVDLVTLQERLKEKDVPPEVASLDFIRDILALVPTSANVRSYAVIVREKAILRRLIRLNEEISNDCYLGRESLDEILGNTEKKIFDLLQSRTSRELVPIRQVTLDVLEKIEAASRTKDIVTGVPTGFADLDYKTSGFQPSDLILLAARPSMGKTAFVLNVLDYVAVRRKTSCMIFSLEMSKEQLIQRMIAMESGVDTQRLRTGNLADADWDAVVEAVGMIGSSSMIIDDTPGISVTELRSKCRKVKLERGLDLVVVDYLQLMSGSGRPSDNRQQEISEISRSLKALAREIKAPVVALSQLSRACESRQDHRPLLSDLRESGAIEQDADVVMFLYRDDYYNKDSDVKDTAEIIVAKQRNGPIGTVNLLWKPQITRFLSIARDGDSPGGVRAPGS